LSTLALRAPLTEPGRVQTVVVGAAVAVAGLAFGALAAQKSLLFAAEAAAAIGFGLWLMCSTRYEVTLAVLMLYLGLLDGYLKLKLNNTAITAGRDLLMGAIAAGALIRYAVSRQKGRLPPLTGFVIAWVLVVLVQLLNPDNGTLTHSLLALRPHLEFVPLFFFGFIMMRTPSRLRGFLVLLLVITAINAIVALIQLNLSPAQLASWGPGYANRINGVGVSGRGFVDAAGVATNRPFGLGSDMGFAGLLGLLAAPAALALFAIRGKRSLLLIAVPMGVAVVTAVVTSQARVAVVGSVISVLFFVVLASTARRRAATIMSVAIATAITVLVVSALTSGPSQAVFSRYSSVGPTQVLSTTYSYKAQTYADLISYLHQIPFGGGIGSVGAGSSTPGGNGKRYDGESEFNVLVAEVGLAGLIVMIAFNLRLCRLSLFRIKKVGDADVRIMLAAIAAPLFALIAAWTVGPTTISTPGAPYMWFVGGVFSYWLLTGANHSGRRLSVAPRSLAYDSERG
jgi:hypothetical protein